MPYKCLTGKKYGGDVVLHFNGSVSAKVFENDVLSFLKCLNLDVNGKISFKLCTKVEYEFLEKINCNTYKLKITIYEGESSTVYHGLAKVCKNQLKISYGAKYNFNGIEVDFSVKSVGKINKCCKLSLTEHVTLKAKININDINVKLEAKGSGKNVLRKLLL